jgi:single-stranded-DNA-specific exonuclease
VEHGTTDPGGEPTTAARWVVAPAEADAVQAVQSELCCPTAIARLLVSRGWRDPAAAARFLSPSAADLLDPFLLLGMAAAVERIQRAVREGEKILIYGDYDVDGTVATVLLKTAIERTAPADRPAQVAYHVPHRIREGYGIQNNILGLAADSGVRLVISVDTGIRAFAAAEEARALGLDLIVTDHHLPDGAAGLPEAVAVINPAQPGCPYPNKALCGAGVAFKLAHALLRSAAKTPEQLHRLDHVLIPSFLKLVAIATIADSVPLTGENRAIAFLGLRELRNPIQPGLRALMQVAEIPFDRCPTATEVGFRLAPRINAAGRMDVASDVVELFLTRDPARATALALKLDELNQARRASEASALQAIELQLLTLRDHAGAYPAECIVLGHPEWHRGVLGILASRVVDRTNRPALIFTEQDGHAHGSGRSIQGFHLLDALTTVHAGSLFARFGGHAHAVGFTLGSPQVELLRERMRVHSASLLTSEMLLPELACDVELLPTEIAPDLFPWLERCEPFGMDNPEPFFLTRGLVLTGPVRIIKERHVCIPLAAAAGLQPGDSTALTMNAMGWSRTGAQDWPTRCAALRLEAGSQVDAVFRLRENKHPRYGGIELELLDLAPSTTLMPGADAPSATTKSCFV